VVISTNGLWMSDAMPKSSPSSPPSSMYSARSSLTAGAPLPVPSVTDISVNIACPYTAQPIANRRANNGRTNRAAASDITLQRVRCAVERTTNSSCGALESSYVSTHRPPISRLETKQPQRSLATSYVACCIGSCAVHARCHGVHWLPGVMHHASTCSRRCGRALVGEV
jgi:hypothetical protein